MADIAARAEREILVPPEQVFAFITRPDAPARTFRGCGPVPGAIRSVVVNGNVLQVGAIRRVENSDGSVVDEEIVELDAPRRQVYRLRSGIRPPFSWLVRGAYGIWHISATKGGSYVTWTFTFELRTRLGWPLALVFRNAFARAMAEALESTERQLTLN